MVEQTFKICVTQLPDEEDKNILLSWRLRDKYCVNPLGCKVEVCFNVVLFFQSVRGAIIVTFLS